jgi:hypothetical protein
MFMCGRSSHWIENIKKLLKVIEPFMMTFYTYYAAREHLPRLSMLRTPRSNTTPLRQTVATLYHLLLLTYPA